MSIDEVGVCPERSNEPHASVQDLVLTAEDAEELNAQAAALRASAVGGQPMWRARMLAQAVALETLVAQATPKSGVLERGNGGEVVLQAPPDAPWAERETARATRDAPDLLDAEASMERLRLARAAGSLSLAVDAAERSGATSPAEQMLAHQMAVSHQLAMKLAAKSQAFLERRFLSYKAPVGKDDEAKREQVASIEAARLATASARMMEATARVAVVLDRLKNGATQTIIVHQKVDVLPGAQSVVNGAVQVTPQGVREGEGRR